MVYAICDVWCTMCYVCKYASTVGTHSSVALGELQYAASKVCAPKTSSCGGPLPYTISFNAALLHKAPQSPAASNTTLRST